MLKNNPASNTCGRGASGDGEKGTVRQDVAVAVENRLTWKQQVGTGVRVCV